MRAVERKLNKKQLVTVWLLIISVVLAAAYAAVMIVIKKRATGAEEQNKVTLTPLEGEALYLNQLIAYPPIEEAQITFLEISNKTGKFGVSRYPDDRGSFLFHYYVDGQKEFIPYMPPITGAEGGFNYESLYAVETGDGYGMIYYLTYLCSALSAPYFTERIVLPPTDTEEGQAQRDALLTEYGLTQSEITTVSFFYGERDPKTGHIIEGTEKPRIILIGKKALSGNGYYFMLADRPDYVYYTRSEYFSYALAGFNEFVKGMLVTEGIDNESVYGPYLTTDFKKWITSVYEKEGDIIFSNEEKKYKNYDNPEIVANGKEYVSVDKGLEFVPESGDFDGYDVLDDQKFFFDLETLKTHPEYARIKNALIGKTVGSYEENKIILTLLSELESSDTKRLDFGEGESVKYGYSVSKIEAVIDESGERTDGTVSSADCLVKITYRYTVGGKTVQHDCHGVMDLSDLDSTVADKFIGLTVGEELGEILEFTVDYTKENSLSATSEKFILTGITAIFDENGAIINAVTEDAYVNISYYRVVGDKKSDVTTMPIRLSDIKDDDKLAPLKTQLIGKSKGALNLTVYNDVYHYEFVRDFVTYEISEIEKFIANEIVVSFRFVNASDRDPFYGDTFYKNTLKNEYALYGLNAGACESAVKLLGGIGKDSNSAVGLSGETVAIGLTHANKEKYGLYAHKIYFEMPRGIFDASEEEGSSNNDQLSDFDWLRTLGFTLYISDPTYVDGVKIRYIGSDMYDLIAKVPAADFDFLDYGFTEFWARRNLMMMDITKLQNLKLEFDMEDLTGSYEFDVRFTDAYGGYVGDKYVISPEQFEGSSPIEHEIVNVKASDDAFDTEFKKMFGSKSGGDLATLYNHTVGGGEVTYYENSNDLLGPAYFNSVYETLQLTRYLGTLTEEEQEAGFAKTRIMRMHVKVDGKENYYTYDFYRIDDRRVMVAHYITDQNGNKVEHLGEVSDFYVSTFAFKKLVNHYIYLLNGKPVDENVHYD